MNESKDRKALPKSLYVLLLELTVVTASRLERSPNTMMLLSSYDYLVKTE